MFMVPTVGGGVVVEAGFESVLWQEKRIVHKEQAQRRIRVWRFMVRVV
jgi:hypothetical protein